MNHNTQHSDSSRLTRRIMRRVYFIAGVRLLVHPLTLKSLLVAVFFWRSTQYVSYVHVIANAPSLFDVESNIRFFSGALAHTGTATLYLYTGILLTGLWIVLDMARQKRHAWF